MKQFTLRLDDELHAQLVAKAKRQHRSLQQELTMACLFHLYFGEETRVVNERTDESNEASPRR